MVSQLPPERRSPVTDAVVELKAGRIALATVWAKNFRFELLTHRKSRAIPMLPHSRDIMHGH
jgi:hypothetical protein